MKAYISINGRVYNFSFIQYTCEEFHVLENLFFNLKTHVYKLKCNNK